MRIQNWDRWRQESDQAQDAIRKFSHVCEHARGWAYEAGWLSSAYLRVIMSLPRAQREEELRMLEDQTKTLEAEMIMSSLMNKETA